MMVVAIEIPELREQAGRVVAVSLAVLAGLIPEPAVVMPLAVSQAILAMLKAPRQRITATAELVTQRSGKRSLLVLDTARKDTKEPTFAVVSMWEYAVAGDESLELDVRTPRGPEARA